MSENDKIWEQLNSEERHHVIYPAESVVRFVKKNFVEGAKILDDGCGAGRHIKFLSDANYKPYGIDITESGVHATRMLLAGGHCENVYGLENIKVAGCDNLPFEDNFFDGVISYGVLYYLEPDAIQESIREIYRVLKPEGKMLLHVRTTADYRFNRDNLVEGSYNQCYINESDTAKSANKESGMRMYFFDKNKIDCWCRMFKDLQVNTESIGHSNDAFADVNFLVEGTK